LAQSHEEQVPAGKQEEFLNNMDERDPENVPEPEQKEPKSQKKL